MKDPVTRYAERIAKGKVPACRTVKWACERHLRDLRRKDLEWRPEEVEELIFFFSMLRHYKGDLSGHSIELEPWQVFAMGSPVGWYMEDGRRRFRESYVEVPRGNGKTTMAAGLPLFGMSLDQEAGAECYTSATKEDQAKLCWQDATKFIKHSPELREIFALRVKEIRADHCDGFLKPLGSDSLGLDGLNPHVVVADEIHAWKDGELWRVIRDGVIKRSRAMFFAISTAGFNTRGFGMGVHDSGVKVLDPEKRTWENDRFFYLMFSVDDPAKWRQRRQWFLANPNLGISISERDFEEDIKTCNQAPNTPENFKVKRLNVWGGDASESWFPVEKWRTLGREIDHNDLLGRDNVAALDLADTNDLTAFVLYFPPRNEGDKGVMLTNFWCPSEDIENREKKQQVPYKRWSKSGLMRVTPGNVTDRRFIERDVVEICERFDTRLIAYDPFAATDLILRLQDDHGLDLVEFRQGWVSMDPAIKELKRLTLGSEIFHDGSDVMEWNVENLAVKIDPAGNVKPDKGKSADKIDGVVAAAMAVGTALSTKDETSVYDGDDAVLIM